MLFITCTKVHVCFWHSSRTISCATHAFRHSMTGKCICRIEDISVINNLKLWKAEKIEMAFCKTA